MIRWEWLEDQIEQDGGPWHSTQLRDIIGWTFVTIGALSGIFGWWTGWW